MVRSVTLGNSSSSGIDLGKASTTDDGVRDSAAASFIRRRICRACKTSANPLPKKKNAGISSSNHNKLLIGLAVTARITATIRKPSPTITVPMPFPVNSSGSFGGTRERLVESSVGASARFEKGVPHCRQNLAVSWAECPQFEQSILVTPL